MKCQILFSVKKIRKKIFNLSSAENFTQKTKPLGGLSENLDVFVDVLQKYCVHFSLLRDSLQSVKELSFL